jgi:hypothetical protein
MTDKRIRRNIYDLKNNYPEEFGRFVMALSNLQKSTDWDKICGIHGLTFNPTDKSILCPKDPGTVSRITGIGEPQYCPHGVRHFLSWHTVYLLEFEFCLNKHNSSTNSTPISLPWFDASIVGDNDYSFLSTPQITIQFDGSVVTIPNPLVGGRIYRYGTYSQTKRTGSINPKSKSDKNLMLNTRMDLNNSLLIPNYESISSTDIPRQRSTITNTIPLESPHNTVHTYCGGRGGALSVVSTAAHDPLFWLHHCNVDRYFYNWYLRVTDNFTKKLTSKEILQDTLSLKLVPFFPSQANLIYTDDFSKYKFCWENDTGKFLTIGDIIDLSQLPYGYDQIVLRQNLMWKPQYCELVGIPILKESCNIKLFVVPNGLEFNLMNDESKELYMAGSSCWIGINRTEIHCERCEVTRANISINISTYLLENKITKKNIHQYQLILEADGLGIENPDGSFNRYSHDEILKDGRYIMIFDTDDIIANREFKFEEKYLHTRLVQGIIEKLNKLGYVVNNSMDWNELIKIKQKIESDWGIDFKDLIKMKVLDKLNNFGSQDSQQNYKPDEEDQILLIKQKIIHSFNTNKELELNFICEGFDDEFRTAIYKCIDEWANQMTIQGIRIRFVELDRDIDLTDTIPDIKFRFVPIDGEYGICGSTYLDEKVNTVYIDIDSTEDFSLHGLFRTIILHEMGHSFGLTHSIDKNSIMHPFITSLNKVIREKDISEILEK